MYKRGYRMARGRSQKVMEFLGVRTEGSMSVHLFPAWMQALGIRGACLRGMDLPIDGTLGVHRRTIQRIKQSPEVYGALIISHKLSIVRAGGELIDRYTDAARLTGEVSALYKRNGKLRGHAADSEICGLAMANIMPADWWSRNRKSGILVL